MKRRVITGLLAAACACFALGVTACGEDDCDHSVNRWRTVTPATCVAEGLEEGVCVNCGEVLTRVLPVAPDHHVYGEWELTLPTADGAGFAKGVCTLNGAHRTELTLPSLSQGGYTTEVVKAETALCDGVMRYVYPNGDPDYADDDVVFDLPIPARGITENSSVADAVEVGSAGGSFVRRGEGWRREQHYDETNALTLNVSSPMSYEFGEGYTHFIDASDKLEYWCSLDRNGDFWCVRRDSREETARLDRIYDASYMNGYRFAFGRTTAFGEMFGAENLLSELYARAVVNPNGDFAESKYTNADEETCYRFSFGYVQQAGDNSGYFCVFEVEFTLNDDSRMIEWFKVTDTTYVNRYAHIDESGNPQSEIKTWEFDENGNAYTLDVEGDRYVEVFEFGQTSKTDDPAEPDENPYTKEKLLFTELPLYDGTALVGENAVEMTAGVQKFLYIRDPQPASAFEIGFDELSFCLLRDGAEIPVNFGTINEQKFAVVASKEGTRYQIALTSRLTGDVTLLIRTNELLVTVRLTVALAAPESLTANVCEYSSSGYVTAVKSAATVYVGQPLYFKAAADAEWIDDACTAVSTNAGNVTIEQTELTEKNGLRWLAFTANTAGTYTVTMTSRTNSSVKCTLTVTVNPKPSSSTLLSGVYTASVRNPRATVTLTFDGGKMKLTRPENGGTVTEYLSFTYTENSGALDELTTVHAGGAELGYSVSLNEGYDLVLRYSDSVSGKQETVIFTRAQS